MYKEKPLVLVKNLLYGEWEGPKQLITWGRGYACISTSNQLQWVPAECVRPSCRPQWTLKECELHVDLTTKICLTYSSQGN